MDNKELINDVRKKLKDITESDFDSLELLFDAYKLKFPDDEKVNNILGNVVRNLNIETDIEGDLKFLKNHFSKK